MCSISYSPLSSSRLFECTDRMCWQRGVFLAQHTLCIPKGHFLWSAKPLLFVHLVLQLDNPLHNQGFSLRVHNSSLFPCISWLSIWPCRMQMIHGLLIHNGNVFLPTIFLDLGSVSSWSGSLLPNQCRLQTFQRRASIACLWKFL